MSELVFAPGQRVVFIGDSITDAGRRTEASAPYGTGYVSLVRAFLLARYPGHSLEIFNHGIGGNTVRDLAARWERDVVEAKPDWLSVKIGINDVWRQVAGRWSEAVLLDEYAETYERLLRRTSAATDARLILMEPYVIESDHADQFRSLIDQYLPVVHKLAEQFGAILIRTQAAFDEALAQQPASFWANDRVHPNLPGHAVIARAFLRGVGYGDA